MATKTEKIKELYDLIDDIEIAMMTTRNLDGALVTRPMATQAKTDGVDLWFVTHIDAPKVAELKADPRMSLAYYSPQTKEWVSISGMATVSQDRQRIHELYSPDWKVWFKDEGGQRAGGPDDPRLCLILVDVQSAHYFKSDISRPRALFEVAKAFVTNEVPDIGRQERLSARELN